MGYSFEDGQVEGGFRSISSILRAYAIKVHSQIARSLLLAAKDAADDYLTHYFKLAIVLHDQRDSENKIFSGKSFQLVVG